MSTEPIPPFYWTRRWDGKPTERPRVNHKPNSFVRLSTARAHASRFAESYRQYGEAGRVTIKVHDAEGLVDMWFETPQTEAEKQHLAHWMRTNPARA